MIFIEYLHNVFTYHWNSGIMIRPSYQYTGNIQEDISNIENRCDVVYKDTDIWLYHILFL